MNETLEKERRKHICDLAAQFLSGMLSSEKFSRINWDDRVNRFFCIRVAFRFAEDFVNVEEGKV